MGFKVSFGNNINLQIYTDSREEADKLFKDLSTGGKVEIPMADQFWGDYFGSLADKFGIHWMIVFANPKQ
jgi:PhnB protein